MKFNITAFTFIGTERSINQDRILVQNAVYENGLVSFTEEEVCFCFVADGVGGANAGDFAAQFVLEKLLEKFNIKNEYNKIEIIKTLSEINNELLAITGEKGKYFGASTTLVGIIINNNGEFGLINIGDSQAWLFRDETFMKISEDQVLNPFEQNSPIISYFGGTENNLNVQINTILRNIFVGDLILLCSDGLFKSIESKQIKAILSNSKTLVEKSKFILNKTLEKGAEDNISCILIKVVE